MPLSSPGWVDQQKAKGNPMPQELTEEKVEGQKSKNWERIYNQRKAAPWERPLESARQRCYNPKCEMYYCYGARGIQVFITKEEVKFLWFRDRASEMKKPSIDRVNNDGNYELSNCRFIELSENISIARRKPIWMIARDGAVVVFEKIVDAQNFVGKKITETNIGRCAQGKRPTAYGYKWEYV